MSQALQNLVNRHPETIMDRNMVQYPVRIVPSLFYAMRHVNDGRYLPEDEVTEIEKL